MLYLYRSIKLIVSKVLYIYRNSLVMYEIIILHTLLFQTLILIYRVKYLIWKIVR
jgi:hypothetical protein